MSPPYLPDHEPPTHPDEDGDYYYTPNSVQWMLDKGGAQFLKSKELEKAEKVQNTNRNLELAERNLAQAKRNFVIFRRLQAGSIAGATGIMVFANAAVFLPTFLMILFSTLAALCGGITWVTLFYLTQDPGKTYNENLHVYESNRYDYRPFFVKKALQKATDEYSLALSDFIATQETK